MLCRELLEMVFEMPRENKIQFRISTSVFSFVLPIACILKYWGFSKYAFLLYHFNIFFMYIQN